MTLAKSHQRSWLEIGFGRSSRRRRVAAAAGSGSCNSCGGGRLGKANNLSTIPLTLLVLIVVEIVVIFSWFLDDTTSSSSSSSSFFEMNFGGRSAVRRRSSSRGDDSERERRRFELLRQQHHQHQYGSNGNHGDAVRDDNDDYNVTDQIRRHSVSRPYEPFPSLFRSDKHDNAIVTDGFSSSKRRYVRERYGANLTIKILQHRGTIEVFDANNIDDDYAHESTAPPPWWQIVDNFYEWKSSVVENYTHEDRTKTAAEVPPGAVDFTPNIRPVILGLDRCEAYRASVPLNERAVGPAGLFSSGTNLLADLVRKKIVNHQSRNDSLFGGRRGKYRGGNTILRVHD